MITLKFKQTKSGYHQFENPALRGVVYFSQAAFTGDPATVTVTVDGALAAPKTAVIADPVKLQAAADKAATAAKKQADRAARLQAQLAALQQAAPATAPAPAPAPADTTPAPAPADTTAPAGKLVGKGKGK